MAKKCLNCGKVTDDSVMFCPGCGTPAFAQLPEEPVQPAGEPAQTVPQTEVKGNVMAGIVGAFLFALIGGLLYFIVYQFGFIVGLCGLITFVLAHFGYGLFAHTRKSASAASIVCSVIMTLLVIFLAEYLSVAYTIYQETHDLFGVTFFEAVQVTPEFLKEPELMKAFLTDLGISYALGALGVVSQIISMRKNRNRQQP